MKVEVFSKFLAKEKKIFSKIPSQDKSHIRTLLHFDMSPEQQYIQTEQDKAEKIEKWLEKQENVDLWNILTQLLVGVYQMHKQGFLGRCITYEEIRVVNNILIFKNFGYSNSMNQAPENKFQKFSTFETDIWLIGAIMWRIISKKQIYDEQQMENNEIQLTFNFQENEFQIDEDLYKLLSQMLQIYQTQRISFLEIFKNKKIMIPQDDERVQICNFYSTLKLKNILKFRKNSFLRDYYLYINTGNQSPKIFCYYIKDCPILKYFYQLYIEIQLLNFAFHLSFFFPNKDPNILTELNGMIIQKMILISKQLKQHIVSYQLPNQFKGQEDLFKNDINNSQLKTQIVSQQNKLVELQQKYFKNSQIPSMDMLIINNKLQSYSTDGRCSIMITLLNSIIKNSTVHEKSYIYIQSVTLEQMFEYEILNRII